MPTLIVVLELAEITDWSQVASILEDQLPTGDLRSGALIGRINNAALHPQDHSHVRAVGGWRIR